MSFPPSPMQFAVPSVALIPAVMPNGGISEVSIEPEEIEEETLAEEEAAGEEAMAEEGVDREPVLGLVAGVEEVTVMKVLGTLSWPWCLWAKTERPKNVAARTCTRASSIAVCLVDLVIFGWPSRSRKLTKFRRQSIDLQKR